MYRDDLIRQAMAAQRKTNEIVATEAGISTKTVSDIRNGRSSVGLPKLKLVADVLGLEMRELFEPATGQAHAN